MSIDADGGADSVSLVLTAQCNQHCTYCYQTAKTKRSMSWATLQASLEVVLSSRSAQIDVMFLGGEPLLQFSKIRRAVEYIRQHITSGRRVKYAISTNGLLIDGSVASYLEEQGFDVQLSFDGVEQAQQYRRPGSFALLDALLDNLRQTKPDLFRKRLRVCATLIPAAVPFLSDSIRYLIDKGVGNIAISPSLMPHPDWNEDRSRALDDEMSQVYSESLEYFRRSGKIPLIFFRRVPGASEPRLSKRPMCGIADGNSLTVDVDGRVCACAVLAPSYLDHRVHLPERGMLPLKISDSTSPDFWRRYAEIRRMIGTDRMFGHKEWKYSSYGPCKDCRYFDECDVCPASIALDVENTDSNRISDFLCAFNKVALKYRNLFPVAPGLRDIMLRVSLRK